VQALLAFLYTHTDLDPEVRAARETPDAVSRQRGEAFVRKLQASINGICGVAETFILSTEVLLRRFASSCQYGIIGTGGFEGGPGIVSYPSPGAGKKVANCEVLVGAIPSDHPVRTLLVRGDGRIVFGPCEFVTRYDGTTYWAPPAWATTTYIKAKLEEDRAENRRAKGETEALTAQLTQDFEEKQAEQARRAAMDSDAKRVEMLERELSEVRRQLAARGGW
jgi:hypothetical protein